ncbi:MAG: type II toxin-antitoxin system RelE/ParE family toxin [Acidobacteriota bacterium]
MSEPLPVQATALAAQHIRKAEDWWRVNRTAAPNAVRLELQRAFVLIASQPRIGSRATNVSLPGVRRIYLPKIKYHLYYHVIASPERVEVVALWHARRGKGPPI